MNMLTVKIPHYETNKEAYRNFILKHQKYIIDDSICNSEVLVDYANEDKDLNINYGEFGEIEEVIFNVLKNELLIDCEYIPRGYHNIGIGKEGQKDNIILINEKHKNNSAVKLLLKGNLGW